MMIVAMIARIGFCSDWTLFLCWLYKNSLCTEQGRASENTLPCPRLVTYHRGFSSEWISWSQTVRAMCLFFPHFSI